MPPGIGAALIVKCPKCSYEHVYVVMDEDGNVIERKCLNSSCKHRWPPEKKAKVEV